MWNNSNTHWSFATSDLKEGWAIFYSFAARSYINKLYGDYINTFDDNTEYAPFYVGPTQHGNIRYANIRYVSNSNEPMKAACACNIWSLYDNYNGGNFELTTYTGDNDDISGYSNLVFESMRSLNQYNSTVSGIHFAFYNSVPAALQPSVADVNFFMYDNLTSIPPHKMKPAQITNISLTNISPTQIRLHWSPQSYPSNYTEVNAPTQYRVYKNVSGTYQLVASSSFGTNSVDIPLSGSSGQYKFTAYNSSGDSYGAVEKQIFNISLPTASYLEPGSGGFYKVNGTNVGTTWNGAYLQGMSPITLEAVPPTGYIFIKWSDGSTVNSRQISSGDVNLYAVYKGLQLSSNQDAYTTNGQKKAVRLENTNYLLSVYKSANNIWVEQSSNNGSSWYLKNTPLDNDFINEYSTPAIDYIPWGISHPFAAIVHNLLKLSVVRENFSGTYYSQPLTVNWGPSAVYITPAVAVSLDRILVVSNGGMNQSGQEGLAYFHGLTSFANNNVVISWTDGHLPPQYKIIPGTTQYSKNPSIVAQKNVGNIFHIVWEEVNSIKYCKATGQGNNLNFSPVEIVSQSSPYSSNQYPSISLANGYPVISWTGGGDLVADKIINKENVINPSKAVIRRKGTSWGDFQVVGNNVNYTNNNSVTSASEKTVIVWSEGITPISKWIRRTNSTYTTPSNLSHSGIQAQVINGSDYQYMTSVVFNSNQLPYFFTKTTTNFSGQGQGALGKITSLTDTVVTFGRAGIVNINGVDFVFNTGDIIVQDSIIEFIEKPDTLVYLTDEELNQYTKSENFELNSNSSFFFSNIYYVVNEESADTSLTENDNVNFKVELVRVSDDQVIGVFDNVNFNRNSLDKYANIFYQVDCSGITAGEYYLRLVTSVVGSSSYALANIMSESSELEKKQITEINFTGTEQPITYELYQNYPNPFNPATTIRYQVPEDGVVSLKIYDILGKEVTTLINDHKSSGKYEVSFDASDFASGVYIYRIQVNNYISVKKMMLLK